MKTVNVKTCISQKVISLGLLAALTIGCGGSSKSIGSESLSIVASLKQQAVAAKSKLDYLISLFVPTAVADASALSDAELNQVVLTEAWIALQEIKVKAALDTESSHDQVMNGPIAVNLLSENPFSVELGQLASSGYDSISMKFHKADALLEGAPEALIENSIYLAGEVNGVAFSYMSDDSTEFILAGPNSVQPEGQNGLIVVFAMANLINKIDFTSITEPTAITKDNKVVAVDPCPAIDPSASDLFTCFEKGLKAEAEFGKHNGDFDLDDSSDETVNE